MGPLVQSVESRKTQLEEFQRVYDEHRFLDAYGLSAEYWTDSTPIGNLTTEEIVFAARLSSRLGGSRLSRHLYREAYRRDPRLPLVRYFTRHLSARHNLLLDELRDFEKDPELGGDNQDLRGSWLAAHAHTYATLRDFSRAYDLLNKAHELSPQSAWLLSQEADILGMADRWNDSLSCAERGCEADPRSPWPVLSLASALLNLGEITEAVRRLSRSATESQFYQVLHTACWYHCALAETLDGEERRQVLDKAHELAKRVEPMVPLADRELKTALARTWLDIAETGDDHTAIERWTPEARSPFHRRVLSNMKANPAGKRIRLPYRRTIQKYVECVPTSISSALSATGVDISVETIAKEVTFGGTHEWAAAEWLRQKGFYVRFFAATPEITARLIERGIGFTVSWDHDESGHAVAIVGIDHRAGTVIAHDPSSFRSMEYLLSALSSEYGPLGVLGMATVPAEKASVLDAILPTDASVVEAAQAQQRALSLFGAAPARPIVEDIEERFPDHPGSQYLRAIQHLEDGRFGRALGGFRKLLERYPQSPAVRVRLIQACHLLADTTLLRETLKSVVSTGKVPGIGSQNEWSSPPSRYFHEYADLLRFSEETRGESEFLLRSVLKDNPRSAGAWHVLADLRWGQNHESAALAYRVASTLAEHNEHYASAYADVLCRSKRIDEGMEWLRNRAERLGKSVYGVSTWITYIQTLEDWGNPDRALSVCRDSLDRFAGSPAFLTFAVPFFCRMGQWDEAEEWFEALKLTGVEASFREAAVYFSQMRGDSGRALEDAEAWVIETPLSMPARRTLLRLISTVRGQDAARDRAAQWMRDRPENEDFEQLFCDFVSFPVWRKFRVLRARVERNPDDAWAWRELTFSAISQFESADQSRRRRFKPRILNYLAQADRLTSEDAATIRAHGLWHEANSEWKEAFAAYLHSIRLDSENTWSYRRAFDVSARLSEAEQNSLWPDIEPLWLQTSGHLSNCLQIMRHLNGLYGPRKTEQIITTWRKLRPDDPNVIEAMADLLLDFGHGRSDAARALELLHPAVERYPYHSGLRFSLARAYRGTGDDSTAGRVFEELVRRMPNDMSAVIQLAWIREREGRTEDALRILLQASEQEPQNPDPLDAHAQILIENQRFDEAFTVLEEALRRLPNSVRIYERTIALFGQIGEDEKAVEAARQGVRAYPSGAYLWLLLGRTLREHPQFAAPGEVEECFRRSLGLNRGLYETADTLTLILAEQRRYDDAFNVLSDVESRLDDPSPVLGRRAWLRRQAGEKQAAITDLADALQRFPGYSWGWNLLLDWLEEDKNWELSQKLLASVPPQMVVNLIYRRDRLLLLEKAGVAATTLDPEWLQLLEDFPEDVPLHLHRYDSLRNANRWDEASDTLERVARLADNDVYLMARLTDVRCHEGRFDKALDLGLKVCFAPLEHSVWPVNRVWDLFESAKKEDSLAHGIRLRLKEGAKPTRRTIFRYADYLISSEKSTSLVSGPLRQTRLNKVTREIYSLREIIKNSSWKAEFHPSDLFQILNTNRYEGLVIRFWKDICDEGLGADSAAWAEAGRAMVNRRRYRAARALFHKWRDRHGVQMWSLANYIQSLSRFRKRDLQEAAASCGDALASLPHDHCARYLAHRQAEASVLLDDKDALLSVWQARNGYFSGELKKGEYFKTSEKHLIQDIPDMVEALQTNNRKAYRKLLWRLYYHRLWNKNSRAALRVVLRIIFILIWMIVVGAGVFRR